MERTIAEARRSLLTGQTPTTHGMPGFRVGQQEEAVDYHVTYMFGS